MTIETRPFDPAEYLNDEVAVIEYLNSALETDDAAFIADALGVVARSKGMTAIAKSTGLGRESLYKALSNTGNPAFGTVVKVMRALGIQLHAEPIRHAPA